MRTAVLVGAALIAVGAWACSSSSSPASPSATPAGAGGGQAVTINVAGNDGGEGQAFIPSPAVAAQGSTVVWANSDDSAHHIVATDGSFDTGVIAAHSSSAQIVLKTDGANYYCTIHPQMVGSIAASNGFPPPCNGPHCG